MNTYTENNVIYLVPPWKLRCYVTGRLRKDTPEEHVRQRWARSLVEEYGYPKSDLGVEVKIAMGRSRKSADLVLFRHNAKHTQDEAFVIIEAKRADKKPSDNRYGEGQLKGTVKLAFVERAGTRDRDLSSSQAAIVTASQMRKERPRSSR